MEAMSAGLGKKTTVVNGQPTPFSSSNAMYFECCDCGLVHLLQLRSVQKGAVLVAYRDDHETKIARARRRRT